MRKVIAPLVPLFLDPSLGHFGVPAPGRGVCLPGTTFEDAVDVLQDMYSDFSDLDLSGEFEVDINDYLPPTGFLRDLFGQALPPTPMPNIQATAQQINPTTNLTRTEQALLSPEEQVIASRT